jgi:hypothetical protein
MPLADPLSAAVDTPDLIRKSADDHGEELRGGAPLKIDIG